MEEEFEINLEELRLLRQLHQLHQLGLEELLHRLKEELEESWVQYLLPLGMEDILLEELPELLEGLLGLEKLQTHQKNFEKF